MHLKEQILSQQPHKNMSTTLRMSRAQSYRVSGCNRGCWGHLARGHCPVQSCVPLAAHVLKPNKQELKQRDHN